MELTQLTGLGVIIVITAILYMVWTVYRSGERPSSLGEWAVQAQAAQKWGEMAVAAAQQLYKSQEIGEDERLHYAETFLAQTLPNLNEEQRRMIIEASVYAKNEAQERGWLPASGLSPLGRPQSGIGEI